jgi:hypothetical protein
MPALATAKDVLRDARQLYNAHRESASKPSKAQNLDKLWEVLNAIHDDGGRDFSLAEVGRRLEKLGGPKTQSLRNSQGECYRQIILAYANAVSGATRYVAKTKSHVEQALELVNDPSVRATLRIALDEAKRLKVTNDNLHSAFKVLRVGSTLPTIETSEATGSEVKEPVAGISSFSLSPRLVYALCKGVDASRLAQQGLQVAKDGSIENDHGDKLFPPAFVTAIQAVLDAAVAPS